MLANVNELSVACIIIHYTFGLKTFGETVIERFDKLYKLIVIIFIFAEFVFNLLFSKTVKSLKLREEIGIKKSVEVYVIEQFKQVFEGNSVKKCIRIIGCCGKRCKQLFLQNVGNLIGVCCSENKLCKFCGELKVEYYNSFVIHIKIKMLSCDRSVLDD